MPMATLVSFRGGFFGEIFFVAMQRVMGAEDKREMCVRVILCPQGLHSYVVVAAVRLSLLRT
jgi:hypothetical protein